MLWNIEVLALTAGVFGCQIWAKCSDLRFLSFNLS